MQLLSHWAPKCAPEASTAATCLFHFKRPTGGGILNNLLEIFVLLAGEALSFEFQFHSWLRNCGMEVPEAYPCELDSSTHMLTPYEFGGLGRFLLAFSLAQIMSANCFCKSGHGLSYVEPAQVAPVSCRCKPGEGRLSGRAGDSIFRLFENIGRYHYALAPFASHDPCLDRNAVFVTCRSTRGTWRPSRDNGQAPARAASQHEDMDGITELYT